nr:hypothetical protein [Tanacetum cinerariifolium]
MMIRKDPPLDQTGGLKDEEKEGSMHQLALHLKQLPGVQADLPQGLNLDNCLPPRRPSSPDRDWNKTLPAAQGDAQSWISELERQTDACSSFNELLDTPIDFSNFIMNQLGAATLTTELLAGPTYELMRGSYERMMIKKDPPLDQTGGQKDKENEGSMHQLALHLNKLPGVQADLPQGLNLDSYLPISTLAKQTDARSSFNELLDTPIDFSNFIMNRLGVDKLTPELLAGPTYELMRGSCNSLTELEYHLEEVYKATTDQLDWVNPEGQQYPHNLLQPLPLIPGNRGRSVILFEHFINNDLEYLRGEHPSDTQVFTMKMEILLQLTSNKLMVASDTLIDFQIKFSISIGETVTHWFILIALSALRRSDNENTLILINLILIVPTEMELILEHTQQGISYEVSGTLKGKWRYLIPAITRIHNYVLIPNYQDFKIQNFRYFDGFECFQAINIGRYEHFSLSIGEIVTHWFTLTVLSALRRSGNENMLGLVILILRLLQPTWMNDKAIFIPPLYCLLFYCRKHQRGMESIKVNGVTDDALRLYLFPHSLTHHATAWFDHLPRNSINTFEQMAKMFLRKYFSPSMVTKLKNEMTNFHQRLDESLLEALERYKLSIDQCHNHNMLPVTQIDTFYNELTLRHRDTIIAAAGGTFMKRQIITLKAEMAEINKNLMRVLQVNQQVKAVIPNCETCGGPHSYTDFPATVGQTQNNQNFQNQNRNQGNHHPQGNNQRRNQFFQGASHGQNPPPAYQASAYQASGYQALVHQPLIPQPQVVTTNEFTNFMKANDSILKNMQTNMTSLINSNFELKNMFGQFMKMNIASSLGSGTLPVERKTEVKKDTVPPTNNRSTKGVQPPVVQTETHVLNFKPVVAPIIEPVVATVGAPKPNQKPSIPYPSRFHDQKLRGKANDHKEKFFQIFKDLNFNISFADALILMPNFGPPNT